MLSMTKTASVVLLVAGIAACDATEQAVAPYEQPQFIVNGEPTGSRLYGNVGALYYDFNRNGRVDGDDLVCTGSLISETVFLTAAHCVEFLPAGSQLYVSFDHEAFPRPSNPIASVSYAYDPGYAHDSGDYHDIAVVRLPAGSTRGITPVKLPTAGKLDELSAQGKLASTLFVNVGYGYDASVAGPMQFTFDGVRKYSKSEFMSLTQAHLGLLMNSNATGEGGDCYGDSGGPKFIDGDLSTIYAIVITGDVPCRATTWDYRLDTPNARAFLGQFVALP
jgi:hypothetical protein